MNQFVVEITFDIGTAEFNTNVVPESCLDRSGDLVADNAVHLNRMPGIAPATNIPPRFRLFILDKERD